MPTATDYHSAAAELVSRARRLELGAHHLARWSADAIDGQGPFLAPVGESTRRTVEHFAAAAEDLRRLARVCTIRAETIRDHLGAVRRWQHAMIETPPGELPPPAPIWTHRWSYR